MSQNATSAAKVRHLLEMIRFSHTVFALPFALAGAVLAWKTKGEFSFLELTGILLCMVFARSAAMAFNRLADRTYDAANPRTSSRHLPAGTLGVGEVWLFTGGCSVGFLASTLLFALRDNFWPLYLAVPVLLFLIGYSYTKRFTSLAHVWLGASLMLAPAAAWLAVLGPVQLAAPLLLGLAVLFWVTGFDILYACQDADFDRRAGLYSIPAKLGVRWALVVARACHALMVVLLLALAVVSPHLGAVFLVGVAAAAALLVYEHWLVRFDDLARVNQAFFHVNGIISVGLLAAVLLQVLLPV